MAIARHKIRDTLLIVGFVVATATTTITLFYTKSCQPPPPTDYQIQKDTTFYNQINEAAQQNSAFDSTSHRRYRAVKERAALSTRRYPAASIVHDTVHILDTVYVPLQLFEEIELLYLECDTLRKGCVSLLFEAKKKAELGDSKLQRMYELGNHEAGKGVWTRIFSSRKGRKRRYHKKAHKIIKN